MNKKRKLRQCAASEGGIYRYETEAFASKIPGEPANSNKRKDFLRV